MKNLQENVCTNVFVKFGPETSLYIMNKKKLSLTKDVLSFFSLQVYDASVMNLLKCFKS